MGLTEEREIKQAAIPVFEKQLGKLNQKTLLAFFLRFHVECKCF